MPVLLGPVTLCNSFPLQELQVAGCAERFPPEVVFDGVSDSVDYEAAELAPLRLELVHDVFRDAWSRAEDGPIPLQPDDEDDDNFDQLTDQGVSMLRVFHEHAGKTAAGTDVVAVEKSFVVPIHDVETGEVLEEQLVGTIDLNPFL